MAKVTLQIIAQVRDLASKELDKINKGLNDTGKAVKKAGFNFTELNRALFSTTAFFGIFSKMFGNFKQSLTEAANLQRVEDSFKNVFGQDSDILTSLEHFSSIGVDRVEAMKEALSLGMLGIAKSSDDAAKILAGAAYGAKRAGVDTTEAMHKIVQGLKDGSLSGLEYLNTIRSSDPALKAQLELLHKYSGSIGGAVSAQAKFNLILSITSRLSELAAGNQEDLVDVLTKVENSASRLRQTLGIFLGKAFIGLINIVNNSIKSLSTFLDVNTKNNKGLIYLAKAIGVVTFAATGLYAALYSINLISKILTSAGIGFPFLKLGILGVAAAFLLTTNRTQGLVEKLKVFGNFIEGVVQLVSSLNEQTGFAKIDSDIKAILEKNGIFTLAQNIARGVSVIKSVLREAANIFDNFKDGMLSFLNPVIEKIKELFGHNGGPWAKSLVDGTGGVTKSLGKLVAGLGTVYLAFKSLKFIKGLVGGVFGGIGKVLGFGGGAPKGTPNDPIYTKSSDESTRGLLERFLGKSAGAGAAGGAASAGAGSLLARAAMKIPGVTTVLQTAAVSQMLISQVVAAVLPLMPILFAALITAVAGYFLNQANAKRAGLGMFTDPEGTIEDLKKKQEAKQRQQFVGYAEDTGPSFIGTPKQKQDLYLKSFGIPKGVSADADSATLAKESVGLGPTNNLVSIMPNIPNTQQGQLNLLKATQQEVSPDEKSIFTDAIKSLADAFKAGVTDPSETAKMTEEAYVKAIQRTKETNFDRHKARRGC